MQYRFFDFTLDSDVRFDSLVPAPGIPRFTLRRDRPSAGAHSTWIHTFVRPGERPWLRVGRQNGDLVLEFCEIARLRCVNRAVWWQRHRNAGDAGFQHALLDHALPFLTAHGGTTVLHAACVGRGGRALLLAGAAGAGKSTLAAALATRSVAAVGDDVTALHVRDGSAVVAQAAYAGIRLWPDAAAALGYDAGGLISERSAKRSFGGGTAESYAVASICILEPAAADRSASIVDLRGREAIMALVRHALVLDPTDRARSAAHLGNLARIAAQVDVRLLTLPRTFEAVPEAIRLLEPALCAEARS